MPKFAEYDVPQGLSLRPSETGSAAWVRAGTEAREIHQQVANGLREIGAGWEKTLHTLGSQVNSFQEKAQANADGQAMLQANSDTAALDEQQSNAIDTLGKATFNPQTGQMDLPDLGAATKQAAQLHDQYQQGFAAIRAKMVATGASDKALNRFDNVVVERQSTMTRKLQAEHSALVGEHMENNLQRSAESTAALAAQNPGQLDEIMNRWRNDTAAAVGNGAIDTNTLAHLEGPLAAAQRHIITNAIDGAARSGEGGVQQALDMIQDKRYSPYIGNDTEALTRHVLETAKSAASEKTAQAREQDKMERDSAEVRIDQQMRQRQPGDPLPSVRDDPYSVKNPEWASKKEGELLRDREAASGFEKTDPVASNRTKMSWFSSRIVGGLADTDPTRARDELRTLYGAGSLNEKDYREMLGEVDRVVKPEEAGINKERSTFFSPRNFGGWIAGPELPGGGGLAKPDAGKNMYEAQSYAKTREDEIRQGKVPGVTNPSELYRPGSKVYLPDDPKFQQYKFTLNDKMDAIQNALGGGGEAPRANMPGQSAMGPAAQPTGPPGSQGNPFPMDNAPKGTVPGKPGEYFTWHGQVYMVPQPSVPQSR
jgi:hypothetical protein